MARPAGRPVQSDAQKAAFRDRVGAEALRLYIAEGLEALSIRRLAREVGCSPATIYAHFTGKPDILRFLWGFVLDEVAGQVRAEQGGLRAAAVCFTRYWLDHPERFRLVFMSSGVVRADVAEFVGDPRVAGYFGLFRGLLRRAAHDPDGLSDTEVAMRADTLVAGLIGIALCHLTIADHDWPEVEEMVDRLLRGAGTGMV